MVSENDIRRRAKKEVEQVGARKASDRLGVSITTVRALANNEHVSETVMSLVVDHITRGRLK